MTERVIFRRVMVVDDDDFAKALQNEELTDEEIAAYRQEDSPVCYELRVASDVDAGFLCHATGLEEGEENEVADTDRTVTAWSPDAVQRALAHLRRRLDNASGLARDLIRMAASDLQAHTPCDERDVVDVLEQADRGYEPGPTAHPAVAAAALLIRHLLAFRVAARSDAWVVSA